MVPKELTWAPFSNYACFRNDIYFGQWCKSLVGYLTFGANHFPYSSNRIDLAPFSNYACSKKISNACWALLPIFRGVFNFFD